jgi:hypothetical protein
MGWNSFIYYIEDFLLRMKKMNCTLIIFQKFLNKNGLDIKVANNRKS